MDREVRLNVLLAPNVSHPHRLLHDPADPLHSTRKYCCQQDADRIATQSVQILLLRFLG